MGNEENGSLFVFPHCMCNFNFFVRLIPGLVCMFRRAWALRAAGGRGQARWRSDDGVTIESRIVLGSASLIPFPLGSPLSSFFFPFFF